MAHTVASVAGRTLVLEKETKLQDQRITTIEGATTTLLTSMARVEEAVKKNGNGHVKTKTIVFRRLLESAAASFVIIVVIVVAGLLATGRLSADDVVNILRAWKGAP